MAYVFVQATYAGYLGYHYADVPMDSYDGMTAGKYEYGMTLLYNPILGLVKNAMLLLYLRLEGGAVSNIRRVIKTIMVINTSLMVAIFITILFQCIPIARSWSSVKPGHCIDKEAFYSTTAAITILTDIPVILIPSWMLSGLQMASRMKVATVSILSLGVIVTGVSIYRLYNLIAIYYGPPNPDPTYTAGGLATSAETNLAIIAACAPALNPLVQRWMPSFFTTRRTKPQHLREQHTFVTIGGTIWIGTGSNRTTVMAGIENGTNAGNIAYEVDIDESDSNSERAILAASQSGIITETSARIHYSSPPEGGAIRH